MTVPGAGFYSTVAKAGGDKRWLMIDLILSLLTVTLRPASCRSIFLLFRLERRHALLYHPLLSSRWFGRQGNGLNARPAESTGEFVFSTRGTLIDGFCGWLSIPRHMTSLWWGPATRAARRPWPVPAWGAGYCCWPSIWTRWRPCPAAPPSGAWPRDNWSAKWMPWAARWPESRI